MRLLVVDTGPLGRLSTDLSLRLRVKKLAKNGYSAIVPAAVLAETITGTRRDAAVHWALNQIRVVVTERRTAELAGRLRYRALSAGVLPSGVDAIVAAHAAESGEDAAVLTSDPGDLVSLLAAHPWVAVLTA